MNLLEWSTAYRQLNTILLYWVVCQTLIIINYNFCESRKRIPYTEMQWNYKLKNQFKKTRANPTPIYDTETVLFISYSTPGRNSVLRKERTFLSRFFPVSLFAFPIDETVAIEKTLPGAADTAGTASKSRASRLRRGNFLSFATHHISGSSATYSSLRVGKSLSAWISSSNGDLEVKTSASAAIKKSRSSSWLVLTCLLAW